MLVMYQLESNNANVKYCFKQINKTIIAEIVARRVSQVTCSFDHMFITIGSRVCDHWITCFIESETKNTWVMIAHRF